MTGVRSLAAAQTVPVRGDVGANVAEHVRLARTAAGEGVRLVLFPELSLTGYELDLAGELAFSEADPRLDPLRELASSAGAAIVAGAPVRLGPRLCIGAFVLRPDGSVDVCTKRHLGAFPPDANAGGPVPPGEASVFHPGDRDPLVRLGGDVVAVAICADVGDPAHAREAAERGATIYLASMFFPPADLEQETARLRTYAIRHSMAVVLANFGGPTGGLPAASGSAVWSPDGEPLARLPGPGAGLAIAADEDGTGWRGRAVLLADA